jgi:hypothetical protein
MRPLRFSINVVSHARSRRLELSKLVDLKLVSRLELGSGAVSMRYEPRR